MRFHTATDFLEAMRNEQKLTERELDEALTGVVGWPGFREVFSVSAEDGTGIDDLREYLLSSALPESEAVAAAMSPELRTLDDPRSLALNTVRAKLLEELPGDVAYALKPKLEAWEVDGGCLRVGVLIQSRKPRQTQFLLGYRGASLGAASRAAEADLQDFFGCDVFLHLNVVVMHKPAGERVRPQDTPTLDTYL